MSLKYTIPRYQPRVCTRFIAIGDIVPGILLFVGVLSRLSAGVLAAIMVSAIFIIKDPAIIKEIKE